MFYGTIAALLGGFIGWIMSPSAPNDIVSAVVAYFGPLFTFIVGLLPEGLESRITTFAGLFGPAGPLGGLLSVAWWFVDQGCHASVALACLAALIGLWPMFVALRVASWVITRVWGSSN